MDEDRPKYGSNPYPVQVLTPSLYGTLLLVYFVLAILTILLPSEPIKCSKEAVCQLRPCFMVRNCELHRRFLKRSFSDFNRLKGLEIKINKPQFDNSSIVLFSFLFSQQLRVFINIDARDTTKSKRRKKV